MYANTDSGLTPLSLAVAVSCLAGIAPAAEAQSLDEVIAEVRANAQTLLQPDEFGTAYAALANFATQPEISAADYRIRRDDDESARLNTFRLPLRFSLRGDPDAPSTYLEASLSYQSLDSRFEVLLDNQVDAEWLAYGAHLKLGHRLPVSEQLDLTPGLSLGLVRLESRADYQGAIAETILRPALKGLVFDWRSNAWIAGASLSADYLLSAAGRDLALHANLSHSWVRTYSASSDFVEFDSQVSSINLRAETGLPIRAAVLGESLSAVAHVGHTAFIGPDRDVLGFEQFFELGLALGIGDNQDAAPSLLRRFNLGIKLIAGEQVSGWTLVLGTRF